MEVVQPKNQPLVTVGVASYNNARFILETLDSIAEQTYKNIEVIIHDDASTDDSVSVIEKWIQNQSLINATFIVANKNVGLCKSLNRILDKSKGKFISFIGSDDRYLEEFVSSRVRALQTLPENVGMVYSQTYLIDEEKGKRFGLEERKVWPSGWVYETILGLKNSFCKPLTSMVRSEAYKKIGQYDENLMYEDLDFFLRLACKYRVIYLDNPQTEYRIVKNSLGTKLKSQKGIEDTITIVSKHYGKSNDTDRIIEKRLQRLVIDSYKNGLNVYGVRNWVLRPFRIKSILVWIMIITRKLFL